MAKYDVRPVRGVDFFYMGNDKCGNAKYAVNYRYFLNDEELSADFNTRREIARQRARRAKFDREITSHIETFFVTRVWANLSDIVTRIESVKAE